MINFRQCNLLSKLYFGISNYVVMFCKIVLLLYNLTCLSNPQWRYQKSCVLKDVFKESDETGQPPGNRRTCFRWGPAVIILAPIVPQWNLKACHTFS